ncbi:hypothetical protein MTO96_006104 [Rhipicephalus appendiculatus]
MNGSTQAPMVSGFKLQLGDTATSFKVAPSVFLPTTTTAPFPGRERKPAAALRLKVYHHNSAVWLTLCPPPSRREFCLEEPVLSPAPDSQRSCSISDEPQP